MIGVASPKRQFSYPGEDIRPAQKVRLQGATEQVVETGRLRLIVTAGLFGVAFSLIGARLVELMAFNSGADVVARSASGAPAISGARANIYDRNGILVATNLPTVNLYADATKIPDAKQAADKLTDVLPDLKYDELLGKLNSTQRFVYLRRHLTPMEQSNVNRLGIPGVYFEKAERRIYPQGSLFSHVVGTTDSDNRGSAGVEKTFDSILGAQNEPIALSLDVRVQHAARETLMAGITRFKASAGTAVVMDATTAEVLAMVSLPDYDPKAVGVAPEDARFNRATLGLYEMGSTFKLFTAAMALDSGTSTLNSSYDATDPIKIGRFTIKDYKGKHRPLTVPEVLIHSSNIAAAKMALDVGTETQKAYLRNLGLLSPLALELPEVGTPQYPASWHEISTITIAYGHGISVTPVHVTSAVSALVNGGTLHSPSIIRRTTGETQEGRRVISPQTSETMRALMRMVVLEGSGKQANVKGYLVGGKTGSAEKVSRVGGYNRSSNRTSFVAAFPIDAPRYVVLVVLDEPRGTKETYNYATAGWNAAPTAGVLIAKIAPMLGVFPIGHEDTFGALPTLISTYGSAAVKAAPAVLTTTSSPAEDSYGEDASLTEDTTVETTIESTDVTDAVQTGSDTIGALIANDLGGSGAAQ